MLILAFETSAKAASAALLEDGKLLAESYQNTGLTHSQTLMVMAENLLHQCGKTVNDVNAVAVAAGPGSFTGAHRRRRRKGFRMGQGSAVLWRQHAGSHGAFAGRISGLRVSRNGRPAESGV